MEKEYLDYLENEVKLRATQPELTSNDHQDIECLLCGNIFHSTAKKILERYEKYNVKGCEDCVKAERNVDKVREDSQNSYDFILNTLKMKSLDGCTSGNHKRDYECQECNQIFQYTAKHLIQRYKMYDSVGCPSCNNKRKRKPYIEEVREKLKDYEILSDFGGEDNISKTIVTFRRKECGHEFSTKMYNMLYGGVKCPVCENIRRKNLTGLYHADGTMVKKQSYTIEKIEQMFEKRLQSVDKPLRFKDINSYKAMQSPMTFICGKCVKEWDARPNNVLFLNSGCPYCAVQNYSQISIKWLNSIMESEGIHIQHAENGGEKFFNINGKRYFVDGYCEETNTVYEFHGSYYHGDPKLFEDDDCPHPFKKELTAKELYERTVEKEKELMEAGYNIVSIWESDYQ